MNKRWDLINAIINKKGYKKYLEIGLESGMNFDNISVDYKISVDPDERANNPTHNITSDAFFKKNKQKFDIIFIDGLHEREQVYNDVINALKVLKKGGTIVCHNMMPPSEEAQTVPRPLPLGIWTGDCWKAWLDLRHTRKDLEMFVLGMDYGCGVITVGEQDLIKVTGDISYKDFTKDSKNYINQQSKYYIYEHLEA